MVRWLLLLLLTIKILLLLMIHLLLLLLLLLLIQMLLLLPRCQRDNFVRTGQWAANFNTLLPRANSTSVPWVTLNACESHAASSSDSSCCALAAAGKLHADCGQPRESSRGAHDSPDTATAAASGPCAGPVPSSSSWRQWKQRYQPLMGGPRAVRIRADTHSAH